MSAPKSNDLEKRLEAAYHRMMERVHEALHSAEEHTLTPVRKLIDRARDTAVELKELSREEADNVAAYLKRDLDDAGEHIANTGEELKAWFRFDLGQIEDRLLELFTRVADQTSVELMQLAERAQSNDQYTSGEITGPGTLYCSNCGYALVIESVRHIQACPECGNEGYQRDPPE
ncbi:MAG TPA: hypothetical protein EYN73_03210 [Chromatiaceae bacterium]|jgi:rubrerythrin|nr:hypothetical protein [Chromatiaceae bacterium]HIN82866.1 hypothetical protein [Chromatiales bacterium]HIA08080.1 hypothetical protein [Chromatiaceae bacterium]HIB83294.1 hypothetical protein [Chromatiaceae bacterium]HIO14663.1 hypothetical protein [Chromatiales bacterium]